MVLLFNKLSKIIDNIKISCFGCDFSSHFVPREGNKVVHFLTHFALFIFESKI